MSYLYDMLKDALGGEQMMASKSTVIANWTPNNVRAIVISRDYIFVAGHVQDRVSIVKVVPLDANLVAKDLEDISRTNYGKPKLNSLLGRRSFSCLEEIYIDGAFMNYPRVVDIVGYVQELVGSVSRLRYFGYGQFGGGSAEFLCKAYRKPELGYSLALDKRRENFIRLEYKDLGNKTWFRNYYLRPKYYRLDGENGRLAIHFRKVESDIEGLARRLVVEEEKSRVSELVGSLMEMDRKNMEYIRRFEGMMSYVMSKPKDDVCRIAIECLKDVLKGDWGIEGFEESLCEDVQLSRYYSNFMVYKKGSIDEGVLKSRLDRGVGFIDIFSLLDRYCLVLSEELVETGFKVLIEMGLVVHQGVLPESEFRGKYLPKVSGEGSMDGFYGYLSDVLGKVL